jgi:hypothetical protein
MINRKTLCDEDCNNCKIINSCNYGMVVYVLNKLYNKFGNGVYTIVQKACPNLTVCRDCRIDDFCHTEKCVLIKEKDINKEINAGGSKGLSSPEIDTLIGSGGAANMNNKVVKGIQGINIVTSDRVKQIKQEALDLRNTIAQLYSETVSPIGVMGYSGPMNSMSESIELLRDSISQLTTISNHYNIPIRKKEKISNPYQITLEDEKTIVSLFHALWTEELKKDNKPKWQELQILLNKLGVEV